LDIRDNDLSEKGLDYFKDLTNLQSLLIGNNNKEKIQTGTYNLFVGSLEPLKGLSKLEELDISNTDINNGLECLSDSVEKIYCDTSLREESDCKHINEQLKDYYNKEEKVYNYQGWRRRVQR